MIQSLANDNDCQHGKQKGKCADCDLDHYEKQLAQQMKQSRKPRRDKPSKVIRDALRQWYLLPKTEAGSCQHFMKTLAEQLVKEGR
ncbi:hypothetical protein [Shewanella acanthi]|uniref:hypothetical protein n=1 Tax=Shewanella acanthi TaxID=2864212 RepID=UPI001C65BA5A|nr:hypothetical protein [Shewanella acanthi]QYJ80708.1 hypothetical protein K0H61_02795 [Shewanella acanthi]